MAVKFLDKTGLGYFWGKIKAWCNSTFAAIAHTHTSYAVKHSYTTAANAAKNWYRIANANTSQTDTTKPIHAQFILTAYNASYDAGYYERWFVNAEVFGRTANIIIFGNTQAPFSQARILYENTLADLDANDRPAIDIYLNYVLPNGTTKIEIEEVYNQGWTFVADGQISASTVPTGFENVTCDALRGNGVGRSTYADYANVIGLQRSNITSNITLADNNTYRSRVLNCTGTITVTVPSINSAYSWFVIKNFNTTFGIITVHPSTTSVLIDESNADIKLQPGEYIVIHSRAANSYSIIGDGRWKTQYGINKDNSTDSANSLYSVIGGTKQVYYTTANSSTKLTDVPAAVNTTLESYTIRHLSTSDWVVHQILHNNNGLYYRTGSNNNWGAWKTFAFTDSSITGNAATASAVAWSGVMNKPTTIADYGITDAKIANGTITLGSNSITPLTSVPSHNQASNTINAMTGYSKPSSSSAIATSDTLNSAIGKLEAKIDNVNDSNIVHRTGNEDISGAKAFSGTIYTNVELARGELPVSDSLWKSFVFSDSTKRSDQNTAVGTVQVMITPSGNNYIHLRVYKWAAGTTDSAVLTVGYPASGDPYASAPSTSENRSADTDIVTRDWIPKDTRIVHTVGEEIIRGTKFYKASDISFTNSPTDNKTHYITPVSIESSEVSDSTIPSTIGVSRLAELSFAVDANNDRRVYLAIRKPEVNSTEAGTIGIAWDNGAARPRAYCTPTPNIGYGHDILTRDWIPKDERVVHSTGNEFISGNKAFKGFLSVDSTSIEFATAPSSTTYMGMYFFSKEHDIDVSGAETLGVSRLAELSYAVDSDNSRRYYLVIRRPQANNTSDAGVLGVAWDAGATQGRAYCTPTPDTGYGSDILTRDWIPRDDRIVRVTGTQTITGDKTFDRYCKFTHTSGNDSRTVSITISDNATTAGCWDTDYSKWIWNSDSNGNASFFGNASTATKLATARNLKVALNSTTDVTFDGSANQNSIPVSGVLAIANGGTGSSTKNFVDLSDSQTVSGTKTFSNNILCNALRSVVTNTGSLTLEGGTSGSGSFLVLYGKDHSNVDRKGGFIIQCRKTDGAVSSAFIGSPEGNLVWKGQTIQTSSDERLKTTMSEVPSDILEAWSDVQWGKFQFRDAVNEKGSSDARYHIGLIAQSVDKVFKDHNKDILKYGILCYDKSIKIEDEEFTGVWTVRYTEALCMEAAYQRRKNKILENRISELETQVQNMLQILKNFKGA